MNDTTDDLVNALKSANWDDLLPRLMALAKSEIAWKLSNAPRRGPSGQEEDRAGEMSAYGWDASSVVQEAIQRALNGRRKWNPAKCTLQQLLKGIIESIISDLFRAKTDSMQVHGDILGPDGEEAEWIPVELENPRGTNEAELEAILEQACEGDRKLIDLGLCLAAGISKPREMAEFLGLNVEELYELKKKFIRKARKSPHIEALRNGNKLVSLESP